MKKTQPEEFDLVILGGGTGSSVAAWTFASEGQIGGARIPCRRFRPYRASPNIYDPFDLDMARFWMTE
jgi:hypothetical protein